ncbi:hypothetical protein K440DRAFT_612188 [Wilcoxina mikolae CBS 423.85]|nr:hypothetical protein K440DRAFT_612188 [Wilcoxina mikolae CBS 423.85]
MQRVSFYIASSAALLPLSAPPPLRLTCSASPAEDSFAVHILLTSQLQNIVIAVTAIGRSTAAHARPILSLCLMTSRSLESRETTGLPSHYLIFNAVTIGCFLMTMRESEAQEPEQKDAS